MQTHLEIPFGDGIYRFALKMRGILAIQEKCGPIGKVAARVAAGWYEQDGIKFSNPMEAEFALFDVLEVCRQGLIDGGKGYVDSREIEVSDYLATHLIQTYLSPDAGVPINRAWELAANILLALMKGYEPAQEEAQKKRPVKRNTKKAGSTEARSSETPS